MQFTHAVPVPVPLPAVDLGAWIFGLTDDEYRACAAGHHAMGIVGGDRRLGVIDVEDVGGTRIVQHYTPRVVAPDRVAFVSEASEGYLLHVPPFRMRVTWDMASGGTSVLRCTIGFDAPRWVTTAGRLNRANPRVHQHLIEETGGFARDIAAKYAAQDAATCADIAGGDARAPRPRGAAAAHP